MEPADRAPDPPVSPRHRSMLQADGYTVLPRWFDPAPIADELDRVLADASGAAPSSAIRGPLGNRFRYALTMGADTPHCRALARRLGDAAAALTGGPVLPGRAKAVSYLTAVGWHRDSDLALRSIGLLAYLEPQPADRALHVVPGSHRPDGAEVLASRLHHGDAVPAVPVPTEPGDLIVLDERVYHATFGAGLRRQWRVDFYEDRPGGEGELRRIYRALLGGDGDLAADAPRRSGFGVDWLRLDERWAARARALGLVARGSVPG